MKRYLYLTHRWLGITLCLFMAMWFFSGMVMLYVGYPKLTPSERLAADAPLATSNCCVDLSQALTATGERKAPNAIRLVMIAGEPTFVFTFEQSKFVAVNAVSGKRKDYISPEFALASARAFMKGADGNYDGSIEEDAWTHSKALDGHRPLHKVFISDENRTLLYVSGTTGEVVRDATRVERFWNWIGAWLHWLYAFRGGVLDSKWHDIVVYSSLLGSILALTGLTVGIMRWRRGIRYKNGSHSPYRDGFMWWHHVIGLVFGATSITFVFSGLMSMNPWKLFDSASTTFNTRLYSGGDLEPGKFRLVIDEAVKILILNNFTPREIEWRLVDGKGYYVAHNAESLTRIISAEPESAPDIMLPFELLERAGSRLLKSGVKNASVMTSYDNYYFARAPHTMHGNVDKRLPVLRLEFNDENDTWVHIDPYTGAVIGKLDQRRRINRWLFAFLHSWDWPPLLDTRPGWDILMLTMNIGGLLLSLTGAVIGLRRLEIKINRFRFSQKLPSL